MTSHTSHTVGRRAGFTLVEIMVVMVIIGLLAAILVPVLGGVLRRTNEAAVKVEIGSLGSALADFKAKFGSDPPDHIHLHELAAGWTADAESRAKILRIWPRFNFTLARDMDGRNGKTADPDLDQIPGITLSGSECLVFFLGGMPALDANGNFFMTGFSRNPTDPFQPRAGDESRDGPFFDFPSARLTDIDVGLTGTALGAASDRFPEFIDSLSNQNAPYLYLSSSGGRGYDDHAGCIFFHPHPTAPSNPAFLNRDSAYRQTAGGPWWNAKSFQIISPGFGPHENAAGQFCPYGISEVYDPEDTSALSEQDADNITNFSAGGRLRP